MPNEETEKKSRTEKISEKEFAAKVIELAEKGMTSEKIGEALRHQGIHSKEYGKISRILKEKGIYQIPEIKNIQEKLNRVTAHKEKNIQDKRAMRERERIFSLLRKQKQYHKIA
ncbi:MAG: hypothetical protein U1B79_00970 [Candidatus Pacearchaeota archaeon]|nr:hypothetical protein [Nanoarchaeota archaeon]MDZ4226662.1 hypothetical protein [Candidatus Pacearchaeota archaeon]